MACGKAIVDAIHSCRVMILLFSSKSTASPHIPNQIERAVSAGAAVIPFASKTVLPGGSLDYFSRRVDWLDALTRPLEHSNCISSDGLAANAKDATILA